MNYYLSSSNLFYFIIVLSSCLWLNKPAKAFTIYLENFSSSEDKGYIGTSPGTPPDIDLVGVDWTIENVSNTGAGAQLTAPTDWFKVTNGTFEGRDLDGPAIWKSPVIPITGYSDVSFSLDFSESGTLEGKGANALDYVNVEYDVDSAVTLIANQNGYSSSPYTLVDDFGSDADPANQAGTITQTGISGDNLQIIVTMQNWSDLERIRFDNVLVEEVPFDFSPSLGLLTIGGLSMVSYLKKNL